MTTQEIIKLPEITDIGKPYGELVNGAPSAVQFNQRYDAGLKAQMKVELALRKPYEKAEDDAWEGALNEVLNDQERSDLAFYRRIHDDFASGKYVGEVLGNAVDWSRYAGASRALKEGWGMVDIHVNPAMRGDGQIATSDSVLMCVPFPPSGFAMAIERSGRLIVYDNEGMAGFAPETNGDVYAAIKSQSSFFEQEIEGLQKGGSGIINPDDYAEREVSFQHNPEMGSGMRVAVRGFRDRVNSPRHLRAGRVPGYRRANVGRRFLR